MLMHLVLRNTKIIMLRVSKKSGKIIGIIKDKIRVKLPIVILIIKEYKRKFNQYPNQLSFLSFDLVGLVYYLILQNNFEVNEKLFVKKNKFKGKIGIFDIKNNKINHVLNFYKVDNSKFKKIF